MSTSKLLTGAEVETALSDTLAAWRLEQDHICRTFDTGNWRVSLMIANVIGHLAEAAWHHPELRIEFGSVAVRLQTHDAGGITGKDIDLARQIEAVVLWQPAGVADDAPDYLRRDG